MGCEAASFAAGTLHGVPIGSYYGGDGREVMAGMARRYGRKKGKRIFFATANKRGQRPQDAEAERKARHEALKRRVARGRR
jgi:ribosomal protein L9